MSSYSILVAEHHEELRKVVSSFLDSLGYEVLETADGAEAMATAISAAPKLILLDLQLPDSGGEEIAHALLKIRETENISIMGWTLEPVSEQLRETLRRTGFVECLQKSSSP